MKATEMVARLQLADEIFLTVSEHYSAFAKGIAAWPETTPEDCNMLHGTQSRLVEAILSILKVRYALEEMEPRALCGGAMVGPDRGDAARPKLPWTQLTTSLQPSNDLATWSRCWMSPWRECYGTAFPRGRQKA